MPFYKNCSTHLHFLLFTHAVRLVLILSEGPFSQSIRFFNVYVFLVGENSYDFMPIYCQNMKFLLEMVYLSIICYSSTVV